MLLWRRVSAWLIKRRPGTFSQSYRTGGETLPPVGEQCLCVKASNGDFLSEGGMKERKRKSLEALILNFYEMGQVVAEGVMGLWGCGSCGRFFVPWTR